MFKTAGRLINFRTLFLVAIYIFIKSDKKNITTYEIKEESMSPALLPEDYVVAIKNKDKLTKRLLPIQIKKGSINNNDPITSNNVEIGKVLIANKFSFALIKFKDKEFEYNKEFKCGEANIEILKPNWLN